MGGGQGGWVRRGHGSLGAPKGDDGDDDDNVWCPQLRARSPFALLHLWVAERFDTFKTVEVHVLLLELLKANICLLFRTLL